VTCKANLDTIEPIIVHEMTHSYLAHLSLPVWLGEGVAVNTVQRLLPPEDNVADGIADVYGLRGKWLPVYRVMQQDHQQQRHYWNTDRMQQFWSGEQFHIAQGQVLAYNLAALLVGQFARDWARFCSFVLHANVADAGQAAAMTYLGLGLGDAVSALLERPNMATEWQPVAALDAGKTGGYARSLGRIWPLAIDSQIILAGIYNFDPQLSNQLAEDTYYSFKIQKNCS